MTTPDMAADQAWGMLADLGGEEKEEKMGQRYSELAALPEEERRNQMLEMARAEYALSDETLRPFTVSRMTVWLKLDFEVAQRIAASYDAVMQKMPGTQDMRRVALVQTLAREFSAEDQELLIALMPAVFAGAPIGIQVAKIRQSPPPEERPSKAGKGWWPFGRR